MGEKVPAMNEQRQNLDRATVWVILGLVLFFAGLIGLVVIVGLVQGTLDPTGVSTLLGGIFTGLISTIIIFLKKGGGGNGTQPPQQ